MRKTRRSVLRSGLGIPVAGGMVLGGSDSMRAAADCTYETLQPKGSGGTADHWYPRSASTAGLLKDAATAFNRSTDQSVSLSQVSAGTFKAELQTEIPAGHGPHTFEWSHDLAGSWDEAGYLSDQSDNLRVDPCQYTGTAWKAGQYAGKTIGLPWAAETVTLIYNEDIVSSPPETLSEMTAVMDGFHDPANDQYGLAFPINPYYVSAFAQAYGEAIYDGEADTLGVASDAVVEGLRVVTEDLKPYMPADPGYGPQTSTFLDGDAAFTINGPWELGNIDSAGIDYGVTTLPDLPDGGTPRPYMGVELVYFARRIDQEPDDGQAAREFAEWFTTNQQQLWTHVVDGNYVPVHRALVEDRTLPDDIEGFAEQVETGYPMPANPKMNEVWGPFGDAVEAAFNDPTQLRRALETAERDIYDAWGETPPGSAGDSADLWHARTQSETVELEDSVATFESDTGRSMAVTEVSSGNFRSKIETEIPSGDGPHLFEWTHDFAGRFDERGLLSDQRGSLQVDSSQYAKAAWEAVQYDGKVVGLPFAGETVTLIYNTDVVSSPPETLSEMKAIMDGYHDPANDQYGLGYPINPYYVSAFAQAYGEEIYDGTTDELGIGSRDVRKGLRVITEDLKPYMPSDFGYSTQASAFREGNAAFTINGPWELDVIRGTEVDYGVTTLPDLPGGGTPRPYSSVELVYFSSVMDAEPSKAQTAREYAEWFTTNKQQLLDHAVNAGYVPVHSGLIDDGVLPDDIQAFAEQIETSYPMPANPKMNEVWAPFHDAVDNVFRDPGRMRTELRAAEREVYRKWGQTPALPGQSASPQDLDSDQLLEDVDGDGDGDMGDVLAYYNNRNADVVRNNPDKFDFDGDGTAGTVFDALRLYEELD